MNRFVIASSVISGVIVGACSPVAPSVSKLSNAATEKSNPTDGSAPSNTSTTTATALNQKDLGSSTESNQRTQVHTVSGFQKHWGKVAAAKPSLEIDVKTLDKFMRSNKASFSITDKKINGREADLAKGKITIYVVVDNSLDKSKAKNLGLDEVSLSVSWDDKAAQWTLSFDKPSQNTGDPVRDSDAEKVRQAFLANLRSVAIEFEAEF